MGKRTEVAKTDDAITFFIFSSLKTCIFYILIQKMIENNPTKIKKCHQNDYKRFINKTICTDDGEVANNELYSIDTTIIQKEEIDDYIWLNLEKAIELLKRQNLIDACHSLITGKKIAKTYERVLEEENFNSRRKKGS